MTPPPLTDPVAGSAPAIAEAIRDAVDAGFPATVADLARLVRIPSVSWPAVDAAHVAESAEAVADLLEGIRHVGGEPRFLSLYFEPGLDEAARGGLVDGWRAAEGHRAWVLARDEAIDAGVYGRVADEVRPRIGDILVAARAGIAYYDRREANRQAEAMIGQHGSLSDEETRVPLIRGGAYSRT